MGDELVRYPKLWIYRCRERKGENASCPVITAGHVADDGRTRSSRRAVMLGIFVAIARDLAPRNLPTGRLCVTWSDA